MSGDGAAVAGSVDVNIIGSTTHATLGDRIRINQNNAPVAGQNVTVRASDDTRVTAAAGSLAGRLSSTGIGAGVEVDIITKNTQAAIGTGATIDGGGNLLVAALSTENVLTVAGAAGLGDSVGVAAGADVLVIKQTTDAHIGATADVHVGGSVGVGASDSQDITTIAGNAAGGGDVGVAGSVDVVVLNSNTTATIDGSPTLTSTIEADGSVTVAAIDRMSASMVAGGLAAGGTAGVGASNTTLVHNDVVDAHVGQNVHVTTHGPVGLSVIAASSESVHSFAVGGGVAGSASVNVLNETTRAFLDSGVVVDATSATPGVDVTASDTTALLGVAGALSIGGTAGVGASADVGVLDKTTEGFIAPNASVDADGNVLVRALSNEAITSIAPGGSVGGSAGIAGSAGVEVMDVTTRAFVGNAARVDTDGSVLVDAEESNNMDVLAGTISVGGSVGVGASAGVPVIDKTTEAFIDKNATVNGRGNGAAVSAPTGEFSDAATPSDNYVSAPAASAGDLNGDGTSDIPSLTQDRRVNAVHADVHGVAVTAVNHDGVGSIGVSAGGGGSVAVNIGGSVHVINTTTSARVMEGAHINVDNTGASAQQDVVVAAGNDYSHLGVAGSLSVSGAVSVSPGAAVLVGDLTTEAFIDDGVTVNAADDILVTANAKEKILLVGAGVAAAGTVSVGGAVDVMVLDTHTTAHVGTDAATDGEGVHALAGGNVLVRANDDTSVDQIAGAAGIGIAAAGIGASVSVPIVTKETTAYLGTHAQVDAMANGDGLSGVMSGERDGSSFLTEKDFHGVAVQASSTEDMFSLAVAVGAGFYAGVAGAVGVSVTDSTTEAFIGAGADVNQAPGAAAAQSVNVSASNKFDGFTIGGGLGAGIAGVAGAVDVGMLRNNVSAHVDGGAHVSARHDIDVNALADKHVKTWAFSFGGGLVGVAGSVSVWSIGVPASGDGTAGGYTVDGENKDPLQSGSNPNARDFANSQSAGDDPNNGYTGVTNGFSSDRKSTATDTDTPDNTQLIGQSMSGVGSKLSGASPKDRLNNGLHGSGKSGTTALIRSDAVLTAGDSIGVRARDAVHFEAIAGAGGVGLVGVGAGVVVANNNSNVEAVVESGAVLRAGPDQGDDVLVLAEMNSSLDGTAFAGAVGLGALSGQVVVLNDDATVWAHADDHAAFLRAGGTITIEAISNRTIHADSTGVDIGGLAAGASIAIAKDGGFTKATAGDIDVGNGSGESVNNFTLLAGGSTDVHADATSVAAGAISVSASVAIAEATAPFEASIATGADIVTTGDVNVDVVAGGSAIANAFGFDVGAGALGASVATATLAPSLLSTIATGVNVNAGGSVGLLNSFNQGRRGVRGARATATAGTGGVINGSGAVSVAKAEPAMDTFIAGGSTITAGGDVNLVSIATDNVDSRAGGLNLGAVGIGITSADAFVHGHVLTHIDDSTVHATGNLTISSTDNATANSVVRGVSGEVVAAGAFNLGRAIVDPTVEASLRKGADVQSHDATIKAASTGFTSVDALGVAAACSPPCPRRAAKRASRRTSMPSSMRRSCMPRVP